MSKYCWLICDGIPLLQKQKLKIIWPPKAHCSLMKHNDFSPSSSVSRLRLFSESRKAEEYYISFTILIIFATMYSSNKYLLITF